MPLSHKPYRYSFLALLVILVWAPLPFASNVLWAEMMLCLMVFGLTILVMLRSWVLETNVTDTFAPIETTGQSTTGGFSSPAKLALGTLILAQLYVFIQFVPSLIPASINGSIGFFKGSIDPHATAVQLLSGLALCCCFYLVITTVNSEKRANLLLLTLVLSGVFQASYGAAMTLSGLEYSFFLEKDAYRGMATGTFINRNHLAGYLVLTLACGVGLMIAGFKRGQFRNIKDFIRAFIGAIISGKGALRIGLVIMVIGLVLTRSRMGNSSFGIGLAVAGTIILLMSSVSKKTIGIFIASIFIIDALIISSFFDLNKLAERLETTSAQTENRDEILRLSLPLVKDNLIVGTGAGTFYTAYPEYRDASAGGGFYVHAHNDYVEFLSERGLLGVLPLLCFFWLCLKQAIQLLKSKSMRKKAMAFTLLMTMIAIVMHSTVDFNLQMPAYALTLVTIWALGFSKPYARSEKKKPAKKRAY